MELLNAMLCALLCAGFAILAGLALGYTFDKREKTQDRVAAFVGCCIFGAAAYGFFLGSMEYFA